MIQNQTWKIGDCQDLMKELDEDSIDLVVTDPPYGYSFMGKDWDKVVPSTKIWKECLRILKPGAFAFIRSAPRQDVLAHNLVNLSDAGFETGFTSIYWTYATGFPKSGNIGKIIDKRLGAERDILYTIKKTHLSTHDTNTGWQRKSHYKDEKVKSTMDITTPATPEAKALDGSYGGFQPKPAVEIIMVVMKPLSESTYVDQALENGKGITWLDDGRIPFENDNVDTRRTTGGFASKSEIYHNDSKYSINTTKNVLPEGRFPANLLVDDDILDDGNITKSVPSEINTTPSKANTQVYGFKDYENMHTSGKHYADSGSFSRYFDIDMWWNEQIKQLPKDTQKTFPFLITPKASKSEKGGATHPTVKPIKLFSWLITIGSRRDDIVLDPFLGSGTTLEAGRLTNRKVIGFELDPQWEKLYSKRAMSYQPPLSSNWC